MGKFPVAVSTNQEHQQHQEIEGYQSRASRASETAYKTKIHQQPPPDRRQNATTTSISSSKTIVEKLTIRRFKSRQLIRERKQQ